MFKILALALFVAVVAAEDLVGDRIVGGAQEHIENRNFQVAVEPAGSICGGSLYKTNWVITAAHCTDGLGASDITVRAGSDYWDDGESRDVQLLIQHPDYSIAASYDNDISLLKLSSPYTLGSRINTIQLASHLPNVGDPVVVSGYGTLSSGGAIADTLRSVTVNYVDFNTCNRQYGNGLTPNMICASAGGKDSCQGDSGGPLTYNGQLLGVVSFGNGCADAAFPGIYSNIPGLYDWINEEIYYN